MALLTAGTLLSQLIAFTAMPILARFYSPSEFGFLSLMLAVSSIVSTLSTLRYEVNIVVPKRNSQAIKLTQLSIISSILVGSIILSCLSFDLVSDRILEEVGLNTLGKWLKVAILLGVAGGIMATCTSWLNRQRKYVDIVKLRIFQALVFAFFSIFFGVLDERNGLLIAQVFSGIFMVILSLRLVPSILKTNFKEIFSVCKKYKSTPKYALPMALIDTVTLQVPLILIGIWFGAEAAGQFGLAWRVLAVPAALLGGAFGQVFFQRFAAIWPNAEIARTLLFRSWMGLAIVGLLPMIIIFNFGEIIFMWVFGNNWSEAGVMASIMVPMLYASFIHSPTSSTSIVIGVQKNTAIFAFIILITRPLAFYVAWVERDINLGLILFSAFEIALFIIFQYYIWRKINQQQGNK